MGVDQIKHHPFFYGVNWTIIRDIEAPFVPRLRSITDTSYFPTEELEQVPEEPAGGDTSGANKDLAFLGYVILRKFPSFIHPLPSPGFCYFLLLFPLSAPFHLPIHPSIETPFAPYSSFVCTLPSPSFLSLAVRSLD